MAFRNMAARQPHSPLKELAEVRWSASPSTEALRVEATGPQGYDIIAPNWLGVFIAKEVDRDINHDRYQPHAEEPGVRSGC